MTVYHILTCSKHEISKYEEDQKEELMGIIEEKCREWVVVDEIEFLRKKKINEKTIVAWLLEYYEEIEADFRFFIIDGKAGFDLPTGCGGESWKNCCR